MTLEAIYRIGGKGSKIILDLIRKYIITYIEAWWDTDYSIYRVVYRFTREREREGIRT